MMDEVITLESTHIHCQPQSIFVLNIVLFVHDLNNRCLWRILFCPFVHQILYFCISSVKATYRSNLRFDVNIHHYVFPASFVPW